MNRINCTFYRPERVNTNEFTNIIGKMAGDLDTLCSQPVKTYDVVQYVYQLLTLAKPLERRPEMYFLGMDEPQNMPSDVRVAYFYRPTYIGTAIIIRAILLHPELLDPALELDWEYETEFKEAVKTVFPGLLLGCTGRSFAGHGYDGLHGLIGAMYIFAKAGTSEFVAKYPDLCKEFTDLYTNSIHLIEEKVSNGKMKNEWGDDYTNEAKRVLEFHRGC